MSRPLSPAEEAKVATFYARSDWPLIRLLVAKLTPEQIDAIVLKVRRELWRDFSGG